MTKQDLEMLAADGEKRLSHDLESWLSFLRTAGRLFGYPYEEQLAIFLQKPEAEALMEYQGWKGQGRFVKRNSKGIAVFDLRKKSGLRYYFDISDTAGDENDLSRLIWKYQEKDRFSVISQLSKRFGAAASSDTVESMVSEAVLKSLESIFEPIDRGFILESVLVMVTSRLGIEHEIQRDSFLFPLNSVIQLRKSGNLISSIGKEILRDISRTVRLERKKEAGQIVPAEKENGYEHHVQQLQRDSAARFESNVPQWISDEPVWERENQLSADESGNPVDLLQPADRTEIRTVSDGSSGKRSTSVEAEGEGSASGTVSEDIERSRLPEMGETVRYHTGRSGTGSNAGTDPDNGRSDHTALSGNDELTSDKALPSLSIDRIRNILTHTPFLEADRHEIVEILSSNISAEQKEEYIKGLFPASGNGDFQPVQKGVVFFGGENRKIQAFLPWNEVIAEISDSVLLGEFQGDQPDRKEYFTEKNVGKIFCKILPEDDKFDMIRLMGSAYTLEQLKSLKQLFGYHKIFDIFPYVNFVSNSKGIHLWYKGEEKIFTWTQARNTIQNLIDQNAFLSPEERRRLSAYHQTDSRFLIQPDDIVKIDKEKYQILSLNDSEAVYAPYDFLLIAKRDSAEYFRSKLWNDTYNWKYLQNQPAAQVQVTKTALQDELEQILMEKYPFSNLKYQIYQQFQKSHDSKENTSFLKKLYGICGRSYQFADGRNAWIDYTSDGISIKIYGMNTQTFKLSWEKAEPMIRRLIEENRYLTVKEWEKYPAFLQKEKEKAENQKREDFVLSKLGIPPEEKRDSLELRLNYFINDLEPYEKKLLDESGIGFFRDISKEQIAEHLKNPGMVLKLHDFMWQLKSKTAYARCRNTAQAFIAELDALTELLKAQEQAALSPKKEITQPKEKQKRTYPHLNFNRLNQICPDVLSGKYRQMEYRAGEAFMPLYIEQIDANRIAATHYYEQNGDLMSDPDMEFIVDMEQGTLEAATFQQDDIALYQNVYPEPGKYIPSLRKSLNSFANQWFKNIQTQGYEPVSAVYPDDTKVFFGNGKEYELGFGHLGNGLTVWNNREEKHGDYVTIAHIDPNRTVTYYEENLPEAVRERIEKEARTSAMSVSQTQDQPVFPAPPQLQESSPDRGDEMLLQAQIAYQEYVKNGSLAVSSFTPISPGKPIPSRSNDLVPNYKLGDEVFLQYGGKELSGTIGYIGDHDIRVDTHEYSWTNEVINRKHFEEQLSKDNRNAHLFISPDQAEMRINFRIENDNVGAGTPGERYQNNIRAIRLLKRIESEHRSAALEEQRQLSQYVGWGGLSDYFDKRKGKDDELKELLTEDEYQAAKESVLTAYYTPPAVIKAMYQALRNFGFSGGNILEPACGVGNFMGCIPEEVMKNSKMYGTEIDRISARIAMLLYPDNDISITGFENSCFTDGFFDAAIGNVPFGNFGVPDKRYDKYHVMIHDYFFIKSLDLVRPGGMIIYITAQGTLDKADPKVRKIIAEKADLIGAIRLPDNTFQASAGTRVTSDILFLQKREVPSAVQSGWIEVTERTGIKINEYYVDHPDMILGNMVTESGPYGPQTACKADDSITLSQKLNQAISKLQADISKYQEQTDISEQAKRLPADGSVRSFSFTQVEDDIYYQTSSYMEKQTLNRTNKQKIIDMIALREAAYDLIDYESNHTSDELLAEKQEVLNTAYDSFVKKHGYIAQSKNKRVLRDDASYPLLLSLEKYDKKGNYAGKSDFFTERTINAPKMISHVDTSVEALNVSMVERGRIDFSFMGSLTEKSKPNLLKELQGIIFEVPEAADENGEAVYQTADEYLSGNIRQKIRQAKAAVQKNDRFQINLDKLLEVKPEDLTAAEIKVGLGADWVPLDVYQEFIEDVFEQTIFESEKTVLSYSSILREYHIDNKSYDTREIVQSYGTSRVNPYYMIQSSLNLHKVKVSDQIETEDGKIKSVPNEKETALAQAKQKRLEQKFTEWVWNDPARRKRLCFIYNERFNAERIRTYDGSFLTLPNINPKVAEILDPHQKNAIAQGIFGGNLLLDHCVGAGKTYEIAGIVMERKRLGICTKALLVVPNHIVGQFEQEFRYMYPGANLLAVSEEDFTAQRRRLFFSKIATGNYDAIIVGHSQLIKIPVAPEREAAFIEEQIRTVQHSIDSAEDHGEFSVKRLEQHKKQLESSLKRTLSADRDNTILFEQLGVDTLVVDEAHEYKNLYYTTKMSSVSGIAPSYVKKTQDLFLKCRYLDQITGNKGVVFATGTPIANSMTEVYTMQRYLDYDYLSELGLDYFDAWAGVFGEAVTQMEVSPEGGGFRFKTRFSRFKNLPELQTMYHRFANVVLADEIDLGTPEAVRRTVEIAPTDFQKKFVKALGTRAKAIRTGQVKPYQDNMLCVTTDGRNLALDQRLIDPSLPEPDHSKVSACAEQVYQIWAETKEKKSTQLIFCDLSTPGNDKPIEMKQEQDGTYRMDSEQFKNVYEDLKNKLVELGIPEEEIAFIHSAKRNQDKIKLFQGVNDGSIRVLMGSTQKMGAGTNVQKRLCALHHLDCPWRPNDLEQREGRAIRRGNENDSVGIYNYVVLGTFDAYMYQTVEAKQRSISQFRSGHAGRTMDEVDDMVLNYAQITAIATGNPKVRQKLETDQKVRELQLLKQNYQSRKYALDERIRVTYPQEISKTREQIENLQNDILFIRQHTQHSDDGISPMTLNEKSYTKRAEAGEALYGILKNNKIVDAVKIGAYRGLELQLEYVAFQGYRVNLIPPSGSLFFVELGKSETGNITRIENLVDSFPERIPKLQEKLEQLKSELESAKEQYAQPFENEQELADSINLSEKLALEINEDNMETPKPQKQDDYEL